MIYLRNIIFGSLQTLVLSSTLFALFCFFSQIVKALSQKEITKLTNT